MNYVGVCAIAKDENYFIEEWVQYHTMIGVEKFIIYDNESEYPLRQTLAGYIECGLVHVYEIQGISPQQQAYQHALDNHGKDCKWLAFIDIDEFIVLKENDNLQSFLACYEDYAALTVNWVMFGSNGYINNPPLPISMHLKEVIGYKMPNSTIKSIVQPGYVKAANLSPHFFSYVEGGYAVNELYMPVHGNNSPPSTKRIQLNHYIFRGQREFQNKVNRWHYNHTESPHEVLWNDYFRHITCVKEYDEWIIPSSVRLNRMMRLRSPEVFFDLNNHGLESKELYKVVDEVCAAMEGRFFDLALKLIVLAELRHPDNLILTRLKAEIMLFKGKTDQAEAIIQGVLKEKFWWEGYMVLYYCYKKKGNEELCSNIKSYLRDLTKLAETQSAEVPEAISTFLKA